VSVLISRELRKERLLRINFLFLASINLLAISPHSYTERKKHFVADTVFPKEVAGIVH
jgi:hypothetical protein